MKKERKTGSTEVQRQITRIRSIYESIGQPIDFETAVDLSLHLGRALDMAKTGGERPQKKRYIM